MEAAAAAAAAAALFFDKWNFFPSPAILTRGGKEALCLCNCAPYLLHSIRSLI